MNIKIRKHEIKNKNKRGLQENEVKCSMENYIKKNIRFITKWKQISIWNWEINKLGY